MRVKRGKRKYFKQFFFLFKWRKWMKLSFNLKHFKYKWKFFILPKRSIFDQRKFSFLRFKFSSRDFSQSSLQGTNFNFFSPFFLNSFFFFFWLQNLVFVVCLSFYLALKLIKESCTWLWWRLVFSMAWLFATWCCRWLSSAKSFCLFSSIRRSLCLWM